MSILRNVAVLALASAALAACASGDRPDGAVAGCPHCGDPVTVETPHGNRVLPRLRLPSPDVDPIATALRWPPFALDR